MNVQEREQLTGFLQQLAQAQAGPKDEEALGMIGSTVARQPDALYLLVQRTLILDGALKSAQSQIAQLQTQLEQQKALASPAAAPANFLDANSWGRSPATNSVAPMLQSPGMRSPAPAYPAGPQAGNYGAPQAGNFAAPQAGNFAAPQAAAPSAGFQAPSFLTGMATTAAGVAAGAFLFQGVNHMFGSHGDNSMMGSAARQQPSGATDNTVINNYYEQPAAADSGNSSQASDFTSVADAADAGDDGSFESA